jgi:hypothetical protein
MGCYIGYAACASQRAVRQQLRASNLHSSDKRQQCKLAFRQQLQAKPNTRQQCKLAFRQQLQAKPNTRQQCKLAFRQQLQAKSASSRHRTAMQADAHHRCITDALAGSRLASSLCVARQDSHQSCPELASLCIVLVANVCMRNKTNSDIPRGSRYVGVAKLLKSLPFHAEWMQQNHMSSCLLCDTREVLPRAAACFSGLWPLPDCPMTACASGWW